MAQSDLHFTRMMHLHCRVVGQTRYGGGRGARTGRLGLVTACVAREAS